MKTIYTTLLTAILFLPLYETHGRIGETYDELVERFGEPMSEYEARLRSEVIAHMHPGDEHTWSATWNLSRELRLTVLLDKDGVSQLERLDSRQRNELPDERIVNFLKAQAEEWEELHPDDTRVWGGKEHSVQQTGYFAVRGVFFSKDGRLKATLNQRSNGIWVESDYRVAIEIEKEKERERIRQKEREEEEAITF